MTEIEITEDQREYARKLAMDVYEDKKDSHIDKGAHAQQNPEEIELVGFLGETVYADYQGFDRPELYEGDTDPGYDFKLDDGTTIDVKSSDRGKDLILFPSDKGDLPDRLVRLYIEDEETARVTLDVSREHFIQNCETRNLGYGDRLFLPAD